MLRAELINGTTARFTRQAGGDPINRISWQVVEFRDATTVQQGLESFTPGQAVRTVSLAATVDPAASVAFSGMQPAGGQNMGSSDYVADDVIGTGSFTFDLRANSLDLQRNNAASSASVGWNVVSFGTAPAAVLELRMDERQWTGAAGEVFDSRSGFDGTAHGGVTTAGSTPALPGSPGSCRYGDFDGSDDHVVVPHDPALNGSDQLVYGAWIQPRSWSGVRQVMAKSVHGGGSGRAQMGLFSEGNVLKLRAETLAGRLEVTAPLPALNSWSHVAGVFSGNELRLYVNGVPASSSSFASTTLVQTTDDLMISRRVGSSQYYFDGFIDEVRVYTRALNTAEIQTLMNETRPCPNTPVGEWHFDEYGWNGTPGEVVDYSGNDHHGTAFNTVTDVGRVCNMAEFGSTGTSDYLSLRETAFVGLTDFTLGVWYRGTQNGSMTLLSGARTGQSNELSHYFNGTNTWRPYVLGNGSGASVNVSGLRDGAWHFVVWTRAGAANCLYVDDVLTGCVTRPVGAIAIDPGGLIVGQLQGSVGGGFSSNRALEGALDELILFDRVLTNSEIASIRANNLAGLNWDGGARACAVTGATGFVLSHDNAGIHCLDEPLSVAAVDAAGVLVTSYANQITLDTGTGRGSWGLISGSGAFSDPVLDDGRAFYVFGPGDNGGASFSLSYPEGASPLNVEVYQSNDVTVRDNDLEGLLSFAPTGFTLTAAALPNPPPQPIDDPLGAQIAGTDFPVHITAYGVTDDDPLCGVIESYDLTRALKFSMSRVNPASGTRFATVNGQSTVTNPAIATAQNVIFDQGQAQVTVKYKDAGSIALNVADDASFPNVLSGGTGTFVVKPAALLVTRVENSTGTANPAAADLSGPRFAIAGQAFVVDVEARDAEGSITPNFGLESPGESVRVVSTLMAPAGGRNGSTGDVINGASFASTPTPGRFTNNSVLFDEVGIIRLTPSLLDGNYLGAGAVTGAPTGNVGRFYPASFELVSSDLTAACGTFTYMDQPAMALRYSLEARNSTGGVVRNYDAVDLGVPVASLEHQAESNDDGIDLSTRLSALASDFDDGVADLDVIDLAFTRAGMPDGPYDTLQIGLSVVDPIDAVPLGGVDMNSSTAGDCLISGTCNARILGAATRLVYGRLMVQQAYGPENLDLDVGLEAQIFEGGTFGRNLFDSCTTYAGSLGSLGGFQGNLQSTDTSLIAPVASTVLVGGANSNSAPLTLSAPGFTHEGSVEVTLDVPAWLEFDWDGAGAVDPSGTATFGRYRGHDRIIYWREVR